MTSEFDRSAGGYLFWSPRERLDYLVNTGRINAEERAKIEGFSRRGLMPEQRWKELLLRYPLLSRARKMFTLETEEGYEAYGKFVCLYKKGARERGNLLYFSRYSKQRQSGTLVSGTRRIENLEHDGRITHYEALLLRKLYYAGKLQARHWQELENGSPAMRQRARAAESLYYRRRQLRRAAWHTRVTSMQEKGA